MEPRGAAPFYVQDNPEKDNPPVTLTRDSPLCTRGPKALVVHVADDVVAGFDFFLDRLFEPAAFGAVFASGVELAA